MRTGPKPLTQHLEKNIISNVIQTARACLNEPSRPYTPAEGQRALFSQNDYANRPPSTYAPRPVLRKPRNRSQDGVGLRTKEKSIGREPLQASARDLDSIELVSSPAALRPVKAVPPLEDASQPALTTLLRSLIDHEEARDLYAYGPHSESDWEELAGQVIDAGRNGSRVETAAAVVALAEELTDATATVHLLAAVFALLRHTEVLRRKPSGRLKTVPVLEAAVRLAYYPSKAKANDEVYKKVTLRQTGLVDGIVSTALALLTNPNVELHGDSDSLPTQSLIYLLGTVKNLSEDAQIQDSVISHGLLPVLLAILPGDDVGGSEYTYEVCRFPARAQVLIQVTGILKNFVSIADVRAAMVTGDVATRCLRVLTLFLEHPELVQNTVRVVSKLSVEEEFSQALLDRTNWFAGVSLLLRVLVAYSDHPAIVSRVAFTLANLAMAYEEARAVIGAEGFDSMTETVLSQYISTAGASKLYFDGLLKTIRLAANVLLDMETGAEMTKGELAAKSLLIVLREFGGNHEEMTLLAVSCLANLMYYDSPQRPIVDDSEIRPALVRALQPALLQTINFEITREALRALSNLTRFESAAREVGQSRLIEPLVLLLDHQSPEIVFYSLGCITNLTHVTKELVYSAQCFDRFVGLISEAGLTAIDISEQAAMVLSNLCTPTKGLVPWEGVAGEEVVKRLISVLNSLIPEAETQESAKSLLTVLKTLKEVMPGDTIPCPAKGCGRKFQSQEKLKDHWERRHMD